MMIKNVALRALTVLTLTGVAPQMLAADFMMRVPLTASKEAAAKKPDLPPKVSEVTPSTGSTSGYDSITLSGAYFQPGAAVAFGDVQAPGAVVIDTATMTVTTPVHAAGTVDITVMNPSGKYATVASAYQFIEPEPTIPAPSIASIQPVKVDGDGGDEITILGADFTDGATVKFGSATAASVVWVDANTLKATTPSLETGKVDVSVTNPDEQGASLVDALEVTPTDYAIRFSGSNWVELNDHEALRDIQEGDYSISAWYQPDAVPAYTNSATWSHGIVVKPGWHLGLLYNAQKNFAYLHQFADGSTLEIRSSSTFEPGALYQVGISVDRTNGTMSLYVNGSLQGQRTFTPGKAAREFGNARWHFGVGDDQSSNYSYFASGVLDDVAFYPKALSGGDMADLAIRKGPAGATSWYYFYEGYGNNVGDSVSPYVGGQLYSAPNWVLRP